MSSLTHRPGAGAEIWFTMSNALMTTKRADPPPIHRRDTDAAPARHCGPVASINIFGNSIAT